MGRTLALVGGASLPADGDTAVDVGLLHPPQACLMLAYLTVERSRRVSRTEVADLLWDERRPATWDAALRGLTRRIRGFLQGAGLPASALVTRDGCYELHLPDGTEVDVEAANRCLDLAAFALEADDAGAALAHARRAAAVLAGPLLPALDHAWVERRRELNRDGLVRSLELAARAAGALGQHAYAISAATEAHRLLPLRESALRAAMAAHCASGNRADALEVFYRGRTRMRRRLGVEPSAQSQQLFLEILREDAAVPVPVVEPVPAARTPGAALSGPAAAAEEELRGLRLLLAGPVVPPPRDRARDLVRMCLLSRRVGTAAEADTACAEAAAIARRLGDTGLLAEAALANATFDRMGPIARRGGLALVEEGLAALEAASVNPRVAEQRAVLLCRRVQYLAETQQGAAAEQAAAELDAWVASGSALGVRSWCLAARLYAPERPCGNGGTGRDRRAATGLELFELARGTDPELALLGLEHRACAIAESGDLDGAYAVMDSYARLAAYEAAPWGLFQTLLHRGFRAAAEGRFVDCDDLADEVDRRGAALASPAVVDKFRAGVLYVPRWLTGRAAELLPAMSELDGWLGAPATRSAVAFLTVAFLSGTAGPVDAARAALHGALDGRDAGGAAGGLAWGVTTFNLVGAATRLGDRAAAERLYGSVRPLADDTCVHEGSIYLGSYQLHLGRLALTCGWWEAAAAHLQAALDRHRRVRAVPWVALAAHGLADALEEGGARLPSARSLALRAEAAHLAASVGMCPPGSLI